MKGARKIGLALGGGGAKGLAHIPVLEVFDELGVRPALISGTSIGAVMGALYASGKSGREIRAIIKNLVFARGESVKDLFKKKDFFKPIEFFDVEWGRGGVFRGDRFIQYLTDQTQVTRFEELAIPLKVVASDFWSSEQVVIETGDLPSAIKASMGLPGVFTPVTRGERVLIDGGGVNPLPHDILKEDCDVVVAVDVMGSPGPREKKIPNVFRAVLQTFDIMQNSQIALKRELSPPDIYIRPDIVDVDILEFDKAEIVYTQTAPACEQLRAALKRSAGL